MKEWQKELKKDELDSEEYGTCTFAGNYFDTNQEALKYFNSLEKLGADVEVYLGDNDAKVTMPKDPKKREQVLLFIIESCHGTETRRFDKKKDCLRLSW